MIQFLNIFRKSVFLRNVGIVASGTAGAQVITMAFAPIITRLYGPELFGLLGTFMAILAILTPMAALAYPLAIVLPKEDAEAKSLAKLSLLLAIGLFIITLAVVLIFGEQLTRLLNADDIGRYLWLIPFSMLFFATYQILQQWLIRQRKFKVTARAAVLQSLIFNGIKAFIGVWYPLIAVLIVLQTLASGFHTLLLWMGLNKVELIDTHEQLNNNTYLRIVACKYKDFPLYRTPQILLNSISQNFPIFLLAAFFGPASAGFYALAKSVIGMPINLIARSFSDVFYPRVSVSINERSDSFSLIVKATLGLAAVGLIPFLIVLITGPYLFGFIFGDDWTTAGEYARWIALWLFFGFINRPSVAAIPVLCLQKWLLFYEVFSAGTKFISFFIGLFFFDNEIFAIAFMSISGVFSYMILIYKVLNKSYLSVNYAKTS